jgi:hypothetical protein
LNKNFVEEPPSNCFFRFGGRFFMGVWEKCGVERGVLMVILWSDCGELWSEKRSIVAAEKHATFWKKYFGGCLEV